MSKAQGYGTCQKRNSKLSKKIVAVIHKMLLPLLVISSLYFFSLSLTPLSTLCNWRLIRVALCQWQQGCHPPVSKSLLLSPSQATADQGHICSKQRTSKGRDMGRGRDSEQQQRDTDRQTDAETRIETKTERNKEGGGGDKSTEGERRGAAKWKERDRWTGEDESGAGNRETWEKRISVVWCWWWTGCVGFIPGEVVCWADEKSSAIR